jgi:hypothetical protein
MQQREWRLGGQNAFTAKCSMTSESLPMEWSIADCGIRRDLTMIWVLSVSNRCKCDITPFSMVHFFNYAINL